MIYNIQSFFLVALEMLCCKLFFETFSEKKSESKWKNNVIWMSLIIIAYLLVTIFHDYLVIKQIFVLMCVVIHTKIYLKISLGKSAILSALFQGLVLVVDYFTLMFNVSIFNSMVEIEKTYQIQSSLLIVLGKVLLLIVILVIKKSMGKESFVQLADSEWLRFIFFLYLRFLLLQL